MRFDQHATLHTRRGSLTLQLHTARHLWRRFSGLMGRRALATAPIPQGLLITRCPSVHGFFLRQTLDIVYVADDHRSRTAENPGGNNHRAYVVTHTAILKPWRVSLGKRWLHIHQQGSHWLHSAHALELPEGSVKAMGINPGDRLEIRP